MVFFTGCEESWLEVNPLGTPTEVSFYTSFEAANQTVTAAYGNLCKDQAFDVDYFVPIGGSPSDDIETGGENVFDWTVAHAGDLFQYDPSFDYINRFWNYNYVGIKLANYAIEKLEMVAEDEGNSEVIQQRIAEMKFLRAFYHFLVAQVFGGGPYVTEVVSPDEFKTTKRTPLSDYYLKLEEDLLAAIAVLNTKSYNAGIGQVGRASSGAARALLGKVYLYESSYATNYPDDERFAGMRNRYAEALEQFDSVIASPDYKLLGLDTTETYTSWWNSNSSSNRDSWGPVGAYRWIFTMDADNCAENVWEIQHQRDELGYLRTRGSYLTVYTTARIIKTFSGGSLPQLGWSFNSPSPYLEKAFGNNDEREDGLLTETIKYTSDLDPRYPVTIGKDGDSVLYESEGQIWVLFDMSGGGKNNLPTGMINRKYECSATEFWKAPKGNEFEEGPMNTRYIRMGDVYLMAAEAAYFTNDLTKALNYVNAVRTRARNSGVVGGYPEYTGYPRDLPSIKFEDIMHERRLELGGEGQRFFDLVRWNRTEFLNITVVERNTDAKFVKNKNEFLPIPLNEIITSDGAIEQNPGY